MADTSQTLAEKLRVEGDKALAFFASLLDEQWRVAVYADGTEWTVRSILAHFVTSERGLLKLFEDVRQGGAGASPEFSIDRYNASQQQKTRELNQAELLSQFKQVRAQTVSYVSSLSSADLALSGRHPAMGTSTLGAMIKMIYLHNQQHLRDIRSALGIAATSAPR